MGSGLEAIGSYAFEDCKKLTSIFIPNSVVGIGWYAFKGCDGLKQVVFENPNGWIVVQGVTSFDIEVFDSALAADYLTKTHYSKEWRRN